MSGGSAATIYSDDGVTTKTNPMTTDPLGRFDFYAADGRYDIVISGTGLTTLTQSSVEIFDATEKATGDTPLTVLSLTTNKTQGNVGAPNVLSVTTNAPSTSDNASGALAVNHTLSASSATNDLVERAFAFGAINNLTGGGHLQNQRIVDITSGTAVGAVTDSCDAIYIETGAGQNGTVTTGRGIRIANIPGTTKIGIQDQVAGSVWQMTSNTSQFQLARLRCLFATALVAGDFALSGGWGNTAAVSSVIGTDQGWTITITANGTGIAANPTITLTFKDGTWTSSPITVTKMTGGTGTVTQLTEAPTATTNVITFNGTPVAASTYIISSVAIGR